MSDGPAGAGSDDPGGGLGGGPRCRVGGGPPGRPCRSPGRQAVLAIVLLLFFEGLLLYHYGWRHQNLKHADLPSFYFAVELALVEGRSPYDFGTIEGRAADAGQPAFPFLYPPPSLVVLSPLALVSYGGAKWAAVVLNHLLALLLAWLIAFRLVRFGDTVFALFVCAFVLWSFPVTRTIVTDQINLVVAVLICLAWLGLRRERAWWPGVPLALAILLKQFPVVLLAVLVVERRWRALAATLAVGAGALAVSVVAVPAEAWRDWLEVVRPSLGYGETPAFLFSPACPFYQGLNGVVARCFLPAECEAPGQAVPLAGRLLTYALALAVVGVSLAACWSLRRRQAEGRIDRGLAVLLPAMFLISPVAWGHHLVFVLPSLAVALDGVLRRSRHFLPLAGLLAACLLGIALPLPIDHPLLRSPPWVHLVSVRTYAVAALWAMLVWFAFERLRGSGPSRARGMPG